MASSVPALTRLLSVRTRSCWGPGSGISNVSARTCCSPGTTHRQPFITSPPGEGVAQEEGTLLRLGEGRVENPAKVPALLDRRYPWRGFGACAASKKREAAPGTGSRVVGIRASAGAAGKHDAC